MKSLERKKRKQNAEIKSGIKNLQKNSFLDLPHTQIQKKKQKQKKKSR
jgi:hypothetical protein